MHGYLWWIHIFRLLLFFRSMSDVSSGESFEFSYAHRFVSFSVLAHFFFLFSAWSWVSVNELKTRSQIIEENYWYVQNGLRSYFGIQIQHFGFLEICSLGFSRLFHGLRKVLILLKWNKLNIYLPNNAKIQKPDKICSFYFLEMLCDDSPLWIFLGKKLTCIMFLVSSLGFLW